MEKKWWCVNPEHKEPCPDADTCTGCAEDCDASYKLFGTQAEATERHKNECDAYV